LRMILIVPIQVYIPEQLKYEQFKIMGNYIINFILSFLSN